MPTHRSRSLTVRDVLSRVIQNLRNRIIAVLTRGELLVHQGRAVNVAADMLLLVEDPTGRRRLELVEVKVASNNAWFASLENLQQLGLFKETTESRTLFGQRREQLKLPLDIPVGGLVVGPSAFDAGRGQMGNAVEPAQKLIDRFRAEVGVNVRPAVWNGTAIQPLERQV